VNFKKGVNLDMKKLIEAALASQLENPQQHSEEVQPRKSGVEVVRSVALPRKFFYGFRPGRRLVA
jgi:hypothetical protein